MTGLTWNKAAGGGIGAAIAEWLVSTADKALMQYVQVDMPPFVESALIILIAGLVTYYTPANVEKPSAVDSTKSGV